MTAKEKVLAIGKAYSMHTPKDTWIVLSYYLTAIIGEGAAEDEAWEDALRRIENQ